MIKKNEHIVKLVTSGHLLGYLNVTFYKSIVNLTLKCTCDEGTLYFEVFWWP